MTLSIKAKAIGLAATILALDLGSFVVEEIAFKKEQSICAKAIEAYNFDNKKLGEYYLAETAAWGERLGEINRFTQYLPIHAITRVLGRK